MKRLGKAGPVLAHLFLYAPMIGHMGGYSNVG